MFVLVVERGGEHEARVAHKKQTIVRVKRCIKGCVVWAQRKDCYLCTVRIKRCIRSSIVWKTENKSFHSRLRGGTQCRALSTRCV